MRAISEEKRNFRKKIITTVGLIVSLVGGILTLLYGITSLISAASWEHSYFYLIIALSALTVFGDIVGFFRKTVGIGISIVIGIIGVISAFILFSPIVLAFFIPVLLILIGGIVGFSANYENLMTWNEQGREGVSGIDERMKNVYHLSLGLLILGWTLFIILGVFFFFLGFIGFIFLLIGIVGLYGVIMYRSRPEKLRNYLLKREKSQEEPKVQA